MFVDNDLLKRPWRCRIAVDVVVRPRVGRGGGSMRARGFTLLEIGVVLLLIGAMLAVAIPSVNALTGANMRRATGMLQGLMRDTYARAALSGNAHRIVFDIDTSTYWVEATKGGVVLPRNLQELTNEGGSILDKLDERIEDIDRQDMNDDDRAKVELLGGPQWTHVAAPGEHDSEELRPQKLPDGCGEDHNGCVRFKEIWVDSLKEPARGGQVAIVFFPGGYAQEAIVTVTDDADGDNVITLEVVPLTAEVYTHNEEIPIPEGHR